MINFDPRLTLAAIFNTRKSDRDTMSTTFLLETAAQLRGNRLLASLKPGAK
jgi:KICSTOR complex C12orf66 like